MEDSDGKNISGEEVRARMKRKKRSCTICIRKESHSCLKSLFTPTSLFYHKPFYQEDVKSPSRLTERHPQDTAVTMTTDVAKSWSLLGNFCVISLKWVEEELKRTEYSL